MARDRATTRDAVRRQLIDRILARRVEIEHAVFVRVSAVSSPAETDDAEYMMGVRATIEAGVELGLAAIRGGQGWPDALPSAYAAQVRRVARRGFSLDSAIRRTVAGEMLFAEFVAEAAADLPEFARQDIRVLWAPLLDRLIAWVGEEYHGELDRIGRSREWHRVSLVTRMLDGAPGDMNELDYELGCWHLGVIASGAGGARDLREIQRALGCKLLLVQYDQDM